MAVAAEAEAFAANHGCLCVETSAKDAVNIGQLFMMISMLSCVYIFSLICYIY